MDIDTAKHALVTGGASGIGLGIAEALAARGVGVTIVDVSRANIDAVLAKGLKNVRGAQLDVRDREGWVRVKAEAEAAFGPVDLLFNNAGIAPNAYELADMDAAHFDLIIGINLVGVFNGVSAFAADMRARGRGHIVNTASMAGVSIMPAMGGYVSSKFGVVGLTETLRAELAPHGVGVSVFCPGMVATSLFANTRQFGGKSRMPEGHQLTGQSPADVAQLVLKGIADNSAYILSDPAMWRPGVEARVNALLEAFGKEG